jgi:transcriptional regulator with PAS, ATPase and Fis domain
MLNMGERNEIVIDHDLTLKEAVKNLEKEMIEKAIKNCGSVNKAAVQLGLSQPALWKKCKVLKIQEQRQ